MLEYLEEKMNEEWTINELKNTVARVRKQRDEANLRILALEAEKAELVNVIDQIQRLNVNRDCDIEWLCNQVRAREVA